MDQIKEAFSKVKQDIALLRKDISLLHGGLVETRDSLIEVCNILRSLSKKIEEDKKINESKELNGLRDLKNFFINNLKYLNELHIQQNSPNKSRILNEIIPAHSFQNSTDSQIIPTHLKEDTPQKAQKAQNYLFSTGNEGVPADRQTNQQTNQQTDNSSYNQDKNKQENSINDAAQILDSLDNLKREIRLKFKKLTDQEFLVFSTIYQLSEEGGYTDYKNLSEKLNLTESSIRDYIGRLIKKGIPLEKIKINNKTIHIFISQNLKKVASISTILQLRAI